MESLRYRALVVDKLGTQTAAEIRELPLELLSEGEVLIRVRYSGINYKDGLALQPGGKIVERYPFVPGIDLSGTVAASADARLREGDAVLITGYGLGVSRFGGFAGYARVPADWVVPLPAGLSLREAMVYGTAGFTAALSVHRLERHGLQPGDGPVLVTGASGGVGSIAVALLARRGYRVAAATGKAAAHGYLRGLGAQEVLGRAEAAPSPAKPLDRQRWAAAVDPVGGPGLAAVLSAVKYGGAVAVSGMAGGVDVPASVYPFILRGVSLIGIDSVFCPMELRQEIWRRLAGEWKPEAGLIEQLVEREIGLDGIPEAASDILAGRVRGRILVNAEAGG